MGFIKNHYFEEINENYRNGNLDADYYEFETFEQWVETADGIYTREEIEKEKKRKQEIQEQYATDPNDPDYLPF